MYEGKIIVAIGDFHQIPPCSGDPVYRCRWLEQWHGSVNCVVFLENDHRFKDDPNFGEILCRMQSEQHTKEDIQKSMRDGLEMTMYPFHQMEISAMPVHTIGTEMQSAQAYFPNMSTTLILTLYKRK